MACVLVLCTGAFGQTDNVDDAPRVDNIFFQTDLREALADVSAQTNVPILIGATVEGVITLELEDMPLPRALDMMLSPGAYVWREINGYILVGPGGVDSPMFLELSDTEEITLSHLTAEAALAMLSPPLREFLTAAEEDNRLVVTAPPATLARIARDVERLDQPSRHVLLEARVVALERDAALDLGVEWDFPSLEAGTFTGAGFRNGQVDGAWQVRVGLTPDAQFTNALNLTLNMMQQNREATIVSNPQLMVRGGQAAQMGVITEERFRVSTGGLAERVQLDTVASGTNLMIRPVIGRNNQITLEMDIEVSNVVGRRQDDLPVVTRRTAQSIVQVDSGGTAAIAGLMDSRTDSLERSVPGASRLPLIGGAFRNETAQNESKQLAIFVTATIVEDPTRTPDEHRTTPFGTIDEEAFRDALRRAIDHLDEEPDHESLY